MPDPHPDLRLAPCNLASRLSFTGFELTVLSGGSLSLVPTSLSFTLQKPLILLTPSQLVLLEGPVGSMDDHAPPEPMIKENKSLTTNREIELSTYPKILRK